MPGPRLLEHSWPCFLASPATSLPVDKKAQTIIPDRQKTAVHTLYRDAASRENHIIHTSANAKKQDKHFSFRRPGLMKQWRLYQDLKEMPSIEVTPAGNKQAKWGHQLRPERDLNATTPKTCARQSKTSQAIKVGAPRPHERTCCLIGLNHFVTALIPWNRAKSKIPLHLQRTDHWVSTEDARRNLLEVNRSIAAGSDSIPGCVFKIYCMPIIWRLLTCLTYHCQRRGFPPVSRQPPSSR